MIPGGAYQKKASKLLLAGIGFLLATSGIGQRAAAQIDLSSPSLTPHGALPLNEMFGAPILESLQPLIDQQIRQGKISPTVYTVINDEDTGMAPYNTPGELLRDLTCRAGIVVSGSVAASQSHLTLSRAAIYTDYDILVKEVIKNSTVVPVRPGNHLIATRPGGRLPGIGGSIQYDNAMIPTLQRQRTYMLFLSQVPSTGGWQPAPDAHSRLVFSTLQMELSGGEWKIYRSTYLKRAYADLADKTLRLLLGSVVSSCQLNSYFGREEPDSMITRTIGLITLVLGTAYSDCPTPITVLLSSPMTPTGKCTVRPGRLAQPFLSVLLR